ncbi:type 2 lanthipeptide synthetase LanM family protein [Phytohabitans suffuscus]
MTTTPAPAASTGPGALLPDGWWVRGLALHERAALAAGTGGDLASGERRLARWRAEHGPGLATRLTDLGLDEDGLLALLAQDTADLAARAPRPEWVDTVENAVQASVALPAGAPVPADWREALAAPLRPFADLAVDRLQKEAATGVPPGEVDISAVADALGARLRQRLVSIAVRTFVADLHRRRSAGQLAGADGRARFADFVRRLTAPGALAGLLAEHPVLARLLAQAATNAADAMVELLDRFAADRADLVATLLGGTDPGPVTAIDGALGDAHRGGRQPSILHFADGRRVVYKPRDLEPQVRLNAAIEWLDGAAPGLDLRGVATLTCPGVATLTRPGAAALTRPGAGSTQGRARSAQPGASYGWAEFVAHTPIADADAAHRFYRRQGALLALLHVLHATDIHCENLIASGDQPVVVDVETLFHPALSPVGGSGDPAADVLADSVHRTALLPLIVIGEQGILDMSGVGGDGGSVSPASSVSWADAGTDRMRLTRGAVTVDGTANKPRLGDRDVDAAGHESAMLDGFRVAYDAIAARREEFAALARACAGMTVRVVVRPTWTYQSLLDETTHPDVLRDALDRDLALGLLWSNVDAGPLLAQLPRHEIAAIWQGDVPLFAGRPGSRDLVADSGEQLPVPLPRSGLDAALDKITALGEVDRQDQEWIISATLATRRPDRGHRGAEPMPGRVSGAAAEPDRLVVAACGLADQLVARGIPDRGLVNWLGLERVDSRQWLVLPMGAGLANGYVGVALFLAQLAELSGVPRYGEVASRAVGAIPRLYGTLAGRPDLVAAIGCGGLHGLGGIAYGLARLSTLLGDPTIREWTATAVEFAAAAAEAESSPDWATGYAGCLAAMTAVHAETGLEPAAALATRCADRLAGMLSTMDDTAAAGRLGFADGLAGIGWALHRFAAQGGPEYAEAARRALRQAGRRRDAGDEAEYGWCRGDAGLTLARSCLAGAAGDELAWTVRLLADRPVPRDLSLCHGELGIAEVLTVLSTQSVDPGAAAARRRRAGLVLDAIQWHGPSCGTPGGVLTPGLLTGLAGIGYGLLRLAMAERVPSALLLEPASRF